MVHNPRELNRSVILAELLRSRPASRKALAEATGISPATVTRAVDLLIASGVLREVSEVISDNPGRRAVLLDVVSDTTFVVGVDLGASNTRIVVTDLLGNPHRAVEAKTPSTHTADDLARWLSLEITRLGDGIWNLVRAVSLGLPGAVSHSDRSVSNALNLPQVEEPEFLRVLESELGIDVLIDNDANYALLGEQHFGAARSTSASAMLTIGSGLGAGLAIEGRILRGNHGIIGEFGQLPVGPLGTRLEHMVTGTGITKRAAEAGIALSSPADLFSPDVDGTLMALRSQFDHALLIVLTAIAVSCEPETIVLGGGIAKSLTGNFGRYQEALEQNLRMSPRLVSAQLGDFSGAVGAVVASMHAAYLDLGVDESALALLPSSQTLTIEKIREAQA
jgi:glucokinase